ncbi:MAG: hypothetical protein HUU15_15740 [Candidatus Brocadiae bacterium]|nr:hypothetical protein [Candidatus Brocadiia bacterium]
MRFSAALPLVALAALAVGGITAAAARLAAGREAERSRTLVDLAFERVDHTVTLPPDHNARATYGVEAVFRVREADGDLARRLVDFHRPKVRQAIQEELARVHYTNLRSGDAQGPLAARLRERVNEALGAPVVVEVAFANALR